MYCILNYNQLKLFRPKDRSLYGGLDLVQVIRPSTPQAHPGHRAHVIR